jgi:hypothetical protein
VATSRRWPPLHGVGDFIEAIEEDERIRLDNTRRKKPGGNSRAPASFFHASSQNSAKCPGFSSSSLFATRSRSIHR